MSHELDAALTYLARIAGLGVTLWLCEQAMSVFFSIWVGFTVQEKVKGLPIHIVKRPKTKDPMGFDTSRDDSRDDG